MTSPTETHEHGLWPVIAEVLFGILLTILAVFAFVAGLVVNAVAGLVVLVRDHPRVATHGH